MDPFQIRDRCKDLVLSDAQLRKIMDILLDDIKKGLSKKYHDAAIVKCFVTYVQDLPNGTGVLVSSAIFHKINCVCILICRKWKVFVPRSGRNKL